MHMVDVCISTLNSIYLQTLELALEKSGQNI